MLKSFFYWLTKIMKLNIKAKKLYIILIALLNFGLCAAHTGIAHADEIDENAWYVSKSMNAPATLPSYRIRLYGPYYDGKQITPPPSMDKWQIAYCVNGYYTTTWYGMGKGYAVPSSIGNAVTAWREKAYTADNLYNLSGDYKNIEGKNTHNDVPKNIAEILKKILYLGYPFNARNIQEKYDISSADFEQLTQAIIYNYTDHAGKGSEEKRQLRSYDPKFLSAYNEIVDLIDHHFDKIVYPESFKVRFFEYYDKGDDDYLDYQNLLTASISMSETAVSFKKVDKKGTLLTGAKFKLINTDLNKEMTTWTSTDSLKTIKLLPGNYQLIEEEAPSGYSISQPKEFKINNFGEVYIKTSNGYDRVPAQNTPTISVVNEKSEETQKVVFSKRNVAGEEIAGAEIQIKQGDKVVESWTSEAGKSHTVELQPGTYTFHEEAAPNGYLKVTDFEFTISEDGKVSLTGKVSDAKVEEGKLVVTDKREEVTPPTPSEKTQKVVFSKRNVAGEEIAGAEIQIKQGDKVVESWTSEAGKSHTVELQPGTYTFHEEAAPNGYLKVTDFEFTISEDGKVSLTGKVSDASMVNGKLVIVDQRKEITPPTPTPEKTPNVVPNVPNTGKLIEKQSVKENKQAKKVKLPKSGTQEISPLFGVMLILVGLSAFGIDIRFRKN